jgi:hypothetical protein
MRYALGLLTVLALIAIGAAGAYDWPTAPSAEQPRLSAIELRPTPRAAARNAKAAKAAKKPSVRRARRKAPRRARASLPRRAATPSGRRSRGDSDDRGATPARVPVPAQAGEDADDDDSGGGDD